MSLTEKLELYMEYKGLNASQLSARLGYESSEKISRLFRGNGAQPSAEIVVDIANEFEDLNLDWWLRDKGEMILEIQVDSRVDNSPKSSNEMYNPSQRIEKLEYQIKNLRNDLNTVKELVKKGG